MPRNWALQHHCILPHSHRKANSKPDSIYPAEVPNWCVQEVVGSHQAQPQTGTIRHMFKEIGFPPFEFRVGMIKRATDGIRNLNYVVDGGNRARGRWTPRHSWKNSVEKWSLGSGKGKNEPTLWHWLWESFYFPLPIIVPLTRPQTGCSGCYNSLPSLQTHY